MKSKYFAILALFITAAVLTFNARATEPQVEVVPFPVGRYDYQDRVVACNLAMNTSLAVDGAERFLSNADYLNQRCWLAWASFWSDLCSRSDIDGTNGFVALYGVLPPGWPGGWKAVDGTYLPITDVPAWKSFYTSMFAAGATNFAHSQALKAQVDAATTLAQVRGIAW